MIPSASTSSHVQTSPYQAIEWAFSTKPMSDFADLAAFSRCSQPLLRFIAYTRLRGKLLRRRHERENVDGCRGGRRIVARRCRCGLRDQVRRGFVGADRGIQYREGQE